MIPIKQINPVETFILACADEITLLPYFAGHRRTEKEAIIHDEIREIVCRELVRFCKPLVDQASLTERSWNPPKITEASIAEMHERNYRIMKSVYAEFLVQWAQEKETKQRS